MNKVAWVLVLSLILLSCGRTEKGDLGIPGPQGIQGATGVAGITGSQGIAGVDATSVTVVQLCSDCIPTYPSVFAEIAFCIGNELYATYSSNGGFSTKLTPGIYNSTGVNCTCSFTVGQDCKVTQ